MEGGCLRNCVDTNNGEVCETLFLAPTIVVYTASPAFSTAKLAEVARRGCHSRVGPHPGVRWRREPRRGEAGQRREQAALDLQRLCTAFGLRVRAIKTARGSKWTFGTDLYWSSIRILF